jgi:D-alanine-D-alanine ligase
MRIGIFFGGRSREREVSFAGGRTVYDLLDKSLFTPVPIFVDSLGNFILLEWQFLYKGSIRDFYPPVSALARFSSLYQVYIESLRLSTEESDKLIGQIGRKVSPTEFADLMDFAFLALHGPFGEDGTIQGLLEFYNIPYSGSGILPSAIGIDKAIQKELMRAMGLKVAEALLIPRQRWIEDKKAVLDEVKSKCPLPFVVKSSTQGSSIGVSIVRESNVQKLEDSINQSFFIRTIRREEWVDLNDEQKRVFVQELCDIYMGTGAPFRSGRHKFYHPEEIFRLLEDHFDSEEEPITLESLHAERAVLIEEFIEGREFSCIVVEGMNGEVIALPPTEIIKKSEIFDYRSKYLPGISRKVTPIDLPQNQIDTIIRSCEELYKKLHFDVYARIDGMIRTDGSIYLNDPNTTSGMMPSSFFFHQAAEIGLSPSQFLTYIIYKSLQKRLASAVYAYHIEPKLHNLELTLSEKTSLQKAQMRIGVVLGGISTERHISVESGRNVFEKLSSSGKYEVVPLFLDQDQSGNISLYRLPMNLLLKDNADDIREKAKHYTSSPVITQIIQRAKAITGKFASRDYRFQPEEWKMEDLRNRVDFVFIGLHGRPGEDGTLQRILETYNIPYNGSGVESSSTTINKFVTNELLRAEGLLIPAHKLINKQDWENRQEELLKEIEAEISYPFIAKPADDGCSSAVKKIDNRKEFIAFASGMFRPANAALSNEQLDILSLKANEEFPCKTFFVIEELVRPNGAMHFLEITGGMLTHQNVDGELQYEIFEPSEALAQKGILSLEEKFLAGEGQNITPARFSNDRTANARISEKVREQLKRAARVLNVEGYCRIDAFVRIFDDERVEVIFIEVNSLPGLTPATCIFHQAAINGYKPFDFLDQIVQFGLTKVHTSAHS